MLGVVQVLSQQLEDFELLTLVFTVALTDVVESGLKSPTFY